MNPGSGAEEIPCSINISGQDGPRGLTANPDVFTLRATHRPSSPSFFTGIALIKQVADDTGIAVQTQRLFVKVVETDEKPSKF